MLIIFFQLLIYLNKKNSNYKSEAKTIQDFHHLTIIHIIIYNCQQIMSQEYKISQMK
jgi:hypothetical protein